MTCIDENVLVDERISRVLTQYRESPKLLFMISTYLRKVAEIHTAICDMPAYFDLATAVGDQLTLIGKRMGFPRCHCICDTPPVFGFACGDEQLGEQQILGFCDGVTWLSCDDGGVSEICIDDDELYRKFLVSRSYQMQSRYSWDDLTTVIRNFYGESATIMDAGLGQVVISPRRELTDAEISVLQLVPRILPTAPGVTIRFHFGIDPVFGFGAGWGGFCEEWLPDGTPLVTEDDVPLVTEGGVEIWVGPLTKDADWLCRTDVKPYSC